MSTSTMQRAFFALKLMKTRLCNKIIDENFHKFFLSHIYEKDVSRGSDVDPINYAFNVIKESRIQFKMSHFSGLAELIYMFL